MKLEWHDNQKTPTLVRCVTVFDMNNDGKLDCAQPEDVDNDGISNEWNRFKAIALARQFLGFNWFSRDQSFNKYLQVSAYDLDATRSPETVHLKFHIGEERVAFSAKFYNVTDGPQAAVNPDINGDGEVDFNDADLIRVLCTAVLTLGWFNTKPSPS